MPAIPRDLEALLEKLTPSERLAVTKYAASLAQARAGLPTRQPRFDWEGSLSSLRGRYTSVSLQHAISAWRAGEP
jgi:hypothetical protein